jgi:nitrogen fixation/metabolism regulation signal transduction histidine kinase
MQEQPHQKRHVRRRYYVAKELRLSVAVIVLWSLLAVGFFTLVAKEVVSRVAAEWGTGYLLLAFLLVMLGYAGIITFFTMHFSNRFLGPFERLKLEMQRIRAGEYHRRLSVRKNDDGYIRSFIAEVNKMLDDYEHTCRFREQALRTLDSELLNIISTLQQGQLSRDEQRAALLRLHEKLKAALESPHGG